MLWRLASRTPSTIRGSSLPLLGTFTSEDGSYAAPQTSKMYHRVLLFTPGIMPLDNHRETTNAEPTPQYSSRAGRTSSFSPTTPSLFHPLPQAEVPGGGGRPLPACSSRSIVSCVTIKETATSVTFSILSSVARNDVRNVHHRGVQDQHVHRRHMPPCAMRTPSSQRPNRTPPAALRTCQKGGPPLVGEEGTVGRAEIV